MEKKLEIIHLRCTKKQKNLIKGKARLYGKSVSQFILEELIGPHVNKKGTTRK